MEINAKIYAAAKDPDLLKKVGDILSKMTYDLYYQIQDFEPDAAFPLSGTWYGFATRVEPTVGPDEWGECLQECAEVLEASGSVVIHFRSPDHPDDYHEYAYTTAGGEVRIRSGTWSLRSYQTKNGNSDVEMVIRELMSERTNLDRARAARKEEKRQRKQAAYGDYEIVDGVIKRYWGKNETEVIPEGVTEIDEFAFVDQRGLERHLLECEDYDAPPVRELIIPEGVRKIGTYAVAYCLYLEKLEIPDSVREIGERAFESCEELKRVKLPEGMTGIADFTFFLCSELREVRLPMSLKKIGEGAFYSCTSLKRIHIPAGVEEIGKEAFQDCMDLKTVTLEEGLKRIGSKAFHRCRNLKTIRIPKSVTEIAADAFDEGCQIVQGEND